MKKESRFILFLLIASLLVWNVHLTLRVNELEETTQSVSESSNTVVQRASTEISSDVTEVVKQVEEKVVSVITQNAGGTTLGSGSGVIYKNISGKVYIITNHHVIENGSQIIVRFANGEEVESELVGSDRYSDLALLEVQADVDIEPFVLGDSTVAQVGEYVIAIGSPIGIEFENSVTFGIISGKDRVVDVDLNGDGLSDWDMVVLQTDAAINPGNSGGALVNMNGELIGINSLKISSGNVEGMGFSIPISEVIPLIEQIETTGNVSYPIVGVSAVSIADMSPYQRTYYQVPDSVESGVLILDVESGSAADKAGIESMDVIQSFDGETIDSFKTFRKKLYQHQSGDVIRLGINRQDTLLEVEVTLE